MPAILMPNVAAALDQTKLTFPDWQLMDAFAMETSTGYCRKIQPSVEIQTHRDMASPVA